MNRRTATVLVDALFLVLLVLLLLPHEPTGGEDPDLLDALVIEARWPDSTPADVDLWVKGPEDGGSIGYSRRQGLYFSLLRDDLGRGPGHERREITVARAHPDGHYVVNLHLFTNRSRAPVPVTVSVWQKRGEGFDLLWRGDTVLNRTGQEITMVRWQMVDDVVIPGSIHDTFEPIRGQR